MLQRQLLQIVGDVKQLSGSTVRVSSVRSCPCNFSGDFGRHTGLPLLAIARYDEEQRLASDPQPSGLELSNSPYKPLGSVAISSAARGEAAADPG